jgi:hypothetical protein
MLVDGWEFMILNPFDKNIRKNTQELYSKNYKNSYNKLIEELSIPDPLEIFENKNLFTFYISCAGELDKIKLEENFDIVFLRSVFLRTRFKNIKQDLQMYYNTYDINVRNLYKSGEYIFLIIEKKCE